MLVNFNPIALDLGFIQVHWYGIAWAFSFLLVNFGIQKTVKKYYGSESARQLSDIVFWGFIGVFVGGRIGYMLFYSIDSLIENPMTLFYLQQGGMSFHGGVIGGMIGAYLKSRRMKFPVLIALDIGALWIGLALFTVRLANFVNGELWGREVDEAYIFAMYFANDPSSLPRHPSQLYEAILQGPVLALFAYGYFLTFHIKRKTVGVTAFLTIATYGVLRFLVEFFREPDAHISYDLFGWVTRGQILSVPLIIFGLWLAIHFAKNKTQPVQLKKSNKKR